MAYKNFIPEIWNETINRNLEREYIFVKDTNRQYEGDVQKMGDTVRILGVGKPTITETTTGQFNGLQSAETVEDTSVSMVIDKMAHFNFKVDDIDKRQGVNGIMEALTKEASEGLADVHDRAVAELASNKLAVRAFNSNLQVTKDNILESIDTCLQKLYENDVKRTSKISIYLSPAIYTIFKQAYIAKDTDNSDILANGAVAKYGNAYVKISNNVKHVSEGSKDVNLCMIKTDRAIAFACPKTHIEPYRPELGFSDALKGFTLYGTKIVRNKELIVMNCYV